MRLAERILALGPWFHNLELGGIAIAPDHFLGDFPAVKWRNWAHALPADMTGWSVLDIGCNAGFYALECKRRGAARVVGIDEDPRYLSQARLAAEVTGLDIEYRELSVYDVARLGARFDLVLFMGVLYHLRHPLQALDLLWEHVVADRIVIQSLLRGSDAVAEPAENHPFEETAIFDRPDWPRLHFVERHYAGDWTNWWILNGAALEAMIRAAGFVIEARPEDETYLCRRGRRPMPAGAAYPARGTGGAAEETAP